MLISDYLVPRSISSPVFCCDVVSSVVVSTPSCSGMLPSGVDGVSVVLAAGSDAGVVTGFSVGFGAGFLVGLAAGFFTGFFVGFGVGFRVTTGFFVAVTGFTELIL